MRILLKIFVLSLLFLGLYDDLLAQRKWSRKALELPPHVYMYFRYPNQDTVIVKGGEVSWRFEYCEATTCVEIEGVGRTNSKDIEAGEWQMTTKPTKTTTYRIFRWNDGSKILIPDSLTVQVVDSKLELKKAWDDVWKAIEEKKLKQIELEKKQFYEKVRKNIPKK